jgi:hypothetical protein
MKKIYALLALAGVLVAGCQTQQQMLQSSQGMAIQTALNRARFDMNCSSATGQVLSTNVSQPSVQGGPPWRYGIWGPAHGIYGRCDRLRAAQDIHRDLSTRWRRLLRCSGAVTGAPASQAETQQEETEITEKKSENSVSSVCSCFRAYASVV